MTKTPSLTYTVKPHPDAKELLGARLQVTLKEAMEPSDLQAGDKVTVTVHDEHGQLLCQANAEVQAPSFPLVKYQGTILGHERLHKCEVIQ